MLNKSRLQKGKALEEHVSHLLVSMGIDSTAMRQHGSGNGLRKGDVANNVGLVFECKNTARFNWKEASEQVKREAMNYGIEAVVWHPPHQPLDASVIILNLHDFLDIFKKSQDPKTPESLSDSRETRYKLQRLIQSAKDVLKTLEP
jgi:hypothetical protein